MMSGRRERRRTLLARTVLLYGVSCHSDVACCAPQVSLPLTPLDSTAVMTRVSWCSERSVFQS
jgi:hypothetical protein